VTVVLPRCWRSRGMTLQSRIFRVVFEVGTRRNQKEPNQSLQTTRLPPHELGRSSSI
jgi:hypothetical protein